LPNVFQMTAKRGEISEVVAMAESLLLRAKTGLLSGLMFISAAPDGSTLLGISGDFSDDLDYAARAADSGFARLTDIPRVLVPRRPPPRFLRGFK
jgi:hypothetical protein